MEKKIEEKTAWSMAWHQIVVELMGRSLHPQYIFSSSPSEPWHGSKIIHKFSDCPRAIEMKIARDDTLNAAAFGVTWHGPTHGQPYPYPAYVR